MRVKQHITDSRGVKKVLRIIPDHWVVRDLSERDYGIDLLVEIFEPIIPAGKSEPEYFEPSGHICHLQLKSSSEPLVITKKGYIGEPLSVRALQYAERYSTPLLLVSVDVSSDDAECSFCHSGRR